MRRPINTVNGTYKDPNLAFSAQDALNVIPMMTEKSGTRAVSQYRQAPGLKPFCRIGTNSGGEVGFVAAGAGRGLRVVDGKLYAVAGRNLWQITSAGVSVNYGTIPGVGRVSMAHNQRGLGNELAIDNGQSRYVFNTQAQDLQKVTDESFPGSIKAVFIDGYIVFVDPQGRYWGHSDLSNALNYNTFDQYEAEGQPDRIVSAHESNRELLIFGQDTTEAYVNNPSGSGEAPFVRATNTVIKSGCAARDSVCDVGPYTVYLDQNRTVQVLNGYTPVPISTSVIDSALQACTKQQIANAYAFAVESEGFQIYYLTVPGKFTFGYDFKNREWHRRSSTGLDWWAVTDVVQWNGSWYALDSRRGDILELRWYDYPFDVQEELVREWVTGTISADQNPIFVNELELLFGCGGQAYTTVDFPEQPVGPSISGTPPAGSQGIQYAGYTFTVTPGDAPISRTIILTGAIPPGLSWDRNTATISDNTPTESGVYAFTLRAIDTNGLYADLDVSIMIAEVILATGSSTGVGQPGAAIYVGSSWQGIPAADFNLTTTVCAYGAGWWVAVNNVGARYSEDLATWSTGTVPGGLGSSPLAMHSRDGIFGACGSSDILLRSTDHGQTFTSVSTPGTRSFLCIFSSPTRWFVGAGGNSAYLYSDDNLSTIQEGTSLMYDMACGTYANDKLLVGGGSSINSNPGSIYRSTDNGGSWTAVVTDAPSKVVSICEPEGLGISVAVCHGGQILWSDDDWDTYTVSSFTLPNSGFEHKILHNGAIFLVTDNNGFDPAQSYTSADGDAWSSAVSIGLAGINGVAVSG